MQNNQIQGIFPLGFFPPFPPFPLVPQTPPTFCDYSDNDTISLVTNSGPSPVKVTMVNTETYLATPTDYFLCVNTTITEVTLTLPISSVGTVYVIKDCSGNAQTNSIIIKGSSGQLVDSGVATINSNFGSITVIFNGSVWSIV